ncbi:MAG: hypothetical protein JNM40_24240 [Myxococcales bacterium]|nr:hypothetical protein [Myxococcales bacterium]
MRALLAASLLCGLAGSIATVIPMEASAYVRTRTKASCRPLRWAQTCIFLQPDAELLRTDMASDAVLDAIQGAIRSWNDRLDPSSFLRLYYLPPSESKEVSQTDRLGSIKFRFERWCRPAKDASSSPICFDPAATAVTTVTFLNKPTEPEQDGQIVDTDIDLNAVGYRFVDGSLPFPVGEKRPLVDLWNVLTHELGHVQGLDHTCSLDFGSVPACMTDDKGAAIPSCTELDNMRRTSQSAESAYQAAMYPTSVAGEYSRRIPTSDDLAGVISTHPAFSDPQICKIPSVVSGCQAAAQRAPHQDAAHLWALLSMLCLPFLLMLRLRRKSELRTP